jgi:hypothetical protein
MDMPIMDLSKMILKINLAKVKRKEYPGEQPVK